MRNATSGPLGGNACGVVMLCLPLRSGFVLLAFMLFSCSLMITVDQMARQLRRFKISYNVGFGIEEATATHSNVLAWKIPGGEEPSRLQSMESDWTDFSFTH